MGRPSPADGVRRAQLDDWYVKLSEGLDTVGRHGGAVSGGERQQLGVARTLLADRPVLVLVEPTAHLDPSTASALADEVMRLTAGGTALLVTHHPEQTPGVPRIHLCRAPAAHGGDAAQARRCRQLGRRHRRAASRRRKDPEDHRSAAAASAQAVAARRSRTAGCRLRYSLPVGRRGRPPGEEPCRPRQPPPERGPHALRSRRGRERRCRPRSTTTTTDPTGRSCSSTATRSTATPGSARNGCCWTRDTAASATTAAGSAPPASQPPATTTTPLPPTSKHCSTTLRSTRTSCSQALDGHRLGHPLPGHIWVSRG
jgi:hypothetical protein